MQFSKKQLIQKANAVCKGNLMETLSIEFVDATKDSIVAKMPVTPKVYQPDGVLHGGATLALAETVGSFAAHFFLDTKSYIVRGIDISAQHVKSVKDGYIYATAKCLHKGRTTQVFSIRVTNENEELITLCKLTTIRLPK
jgi:uncharacterized protein (TIGR00369 family)